MNPTKIQAIWLDNQRSFQPIPSNEPVTVVSEELTCVISFNIISSPEHPIEPVTVVSEELTCVISFNIISSPEHLIVLGLP